jgi:uncharacterized membrane protein (DUF373 family)
LSEVTEKNAPLEAPDQTDQKRSKEHPRGVAGTIWVLEHAQDLMSVVVGVLLVVLAAVVLVVAVADFFRDAMHGPVETAAVNLLDRVLLVLILVEIVHTVVLSLRAHHLVAQPLLAVGLVAVIRKILFVLSSDTTASTSELALLIGMIAVFVAALLLVSRYDRPDGSRLGCWRGARETDQRTSSCP